MPQLEGHLILLFWGRISPMLTNATISRELAALKRAFSLAIANQSLRFKPHIPMLREQYQHWLPLVR